MATKKRPPGRRKGTLPPAEFVHPIHVKFAADQYAAIQAAAAADGRPMAQWIRVTLASAIEAQKKRESA